MTKGQILTALFSRKLLIAALPALIAAFFTVCTAPVAPAPAKAQAATAPAASGQKATPQDRQIQALIDAIKNDKTRQKLIDALEKASGSAAPASRGRSARPRRTRAWPRRAPGRRVHTVHRARCGAFGAGLRQSVDPGAVAPVRARPGTDACASGRGPRCCAVHRRDLSHLLHPALARREAVPAHRRLCRGRRIPSAGFPRGRVRRDRRGCRGAGLGGGLSCHAVLLRAVRRRRSPAVALSKRLPSGRALQGASEDRPLSGDRRPQAHQHRRRGGPASQQPSCLDRRNPRLRPALRGADLQSEPFPCGRPGDVRPALAGCAGDCRLDDSPPPLRGAQLAAGRDHRSQGAVPRRRR